MVYGGQVVVLPINARCDPMRQVIPIRFEIHIDVQRKRIFDDQVPESIIYLRRLLAFNHFECRKCCLASMCFRLELELELLVYSGTPGVQKDG